MFTDFQMQKLKAFADFQTLTEIYFVVVEHNGQDCNNPFYDETLRWEVDPVVYYGQEFFEEWAEMVKAFILSHHGRF